MFLLDMLRFGGLPTLIVLALGVVSLLIGVVGGVLIALKKSVPPAAVLVPIAGSAVVALIIYYVSVASISDAVASAPAEMKQSMVAMYLSQSLSSSALAALSMMVAVVPTMWLAMIIGFRQEKRSWGMGLFAATILIVCSLSPFLGLMASASVWLVVARAIGVALVVLPVAVTLLSTDEPGRLAGATASGLAALAVIGGVVFEACMGMREVFIAVATAPVDMKSQFLANGIDAVHGVASLGWISVALVLLLAVVAAVRAGRSPGRLGVAVGLAAVGFSVVMLWADLAGVIGRVLQ